jgi:hypothetical protein
MPKPIDLLGMGPTREVIELSNGNFLIRVTPPAWSGILGSKSVELSVDQFSRYYEWMSTNTLIQDALPDLTPAQREILLNGT